jgi:hypothetical protein
MSSGVQAAIKGFALAHAGPHRAVKSGHKQSSQRAITVQSIPPGSPAVGRKERESKNQQSG